MRRWLACLFILHMAGCLSSGPLVGMVSPGSFTSRTLRIRNLSREYAVARVTAPGAAPMVTPALCPGAESYHEMMAQFGTLCPESLRFEIATYSRANPQVSPLEDETLSSQPFAAVGITLTATRDYGCAADPSLVSIDTVIDCAIIEANPQAGTIGFQAGFLPSQQQGGLQIADPPAPSAPEMFPLRGRVIDASGQPLPGVEVRLPQLGASVYTDSDGRFSVMRPVGRYELEPVLPGMDVSPVSRSFSHLDHDEVPVEFIAVASEEEKG